ncbi:hypothetical protein Scep_023831 [Stephania cephalantha]|uniref:Uncharacterized protein n=1 Tax=Stephania cephalantha TaxID=152367 RepID=A0AAP0EVE6_9MAGN
MRSMMMNFEELPKGIDGRKRAKCNYCKLEYIHDSRFDTGNLQRHTASCLKRKHHDISQLFLSQDSGSISFGSSKFDPERFRELLTEAIVMHDLPFNFVDYEGIKRLFIYLYKDVQLVTRNTAKADIINRYKKEKEIVKSLLDDAPGRISFTSDLWTSLTTDGYMCLTCHFIDNNWTLQKRVLSYTFMPPPHSGLALSTKIHNLLCEWGLEGIVFSITLDNAYTNDLSVDTLRDELNLKDLLVCKGDHFHMRCCAHILNLIVQEGMKGVDPSIVKIRESVKYVKGSQARKHKFLECVSLVSSENKGLSQDVSTRWNSTYLMLQNAIHHRRAFQHLDLIDSNYKYCRSKVEWEKIEQFCSFLKVLYDSTLMFYGTNYPTANLYFPAVYLCYIELKKQIEGDNEHLKVMASKMWLKLRSIGLNFVQLWLLHVCWIRVIR